MMQLYDMSKDFAQDLQKWMKSRFLAPILNQEGGWEYWVQIDFVAWLDENKLDKNNSKTQWDFRREVILNTIRPDWVVNMTLKTNMWAVNIKAQTPKYNTDNLLQQVEIDLKKLDSIGSGYNKLMLAAVVDLNKKGAYDILKQNYKFQDVFIYEREIAFLSKTWQ